jgi:hypothetical protein
MAFVKARTGLVVFNVARTQIETLFPFVEIEESARDTDQKGLNLSFV